MTAVKHEWRKREKELYCPKQQALQITVPSMKFLVLDGVGNPNHAAFADDIEALYSLSYGIKMLPKKGVTPDGYVQHTHPHLLGCGNGKFGNAGLVEFGTQAELRIEAQVLHMGRPACSALCHKDHPWHSMP